MVIRAINITLSVLVALSVACVGLLLLAAFAITMMHVLAICGLFVYHFGNS